MNRKIEITLSEPMMLYASLKFDLKGISYLKEGETVTLEETGKVHVNQDGKECRVLRLRKPTRNYYVLQTI